MLMYDLFLFLLLILIQKFTLHSDPEEDSPYPEVRSAVANTDDPEMYCSTARTWIIGVMLSMLIPGLNQFFFFRFPSVQLTGYVRREPMQLFVKLSIV